MAKVKRYSFKIDLEISFGFWALLPAINLNLSCRELEFEWLCIGIYIKRQESKSNNNVDALEESIQSWGRSFRVDSCISDSHRKNHDV